MNRIPQDASEAREVLQVTFDGTDEVCAITALTCIGFQFLRGFVAASNDSPERSCQHIQAATEIADKVVHHLAPQVVNAVHRKIHDAPDPREN